MDEIMQIINGTTNGRELYQTINLLEELLTMARNKLSMEYIYCDNCDTYYKVDEYKYYDDEVDLKYIYQIPNSNDKSGGTDLFPVSVRECPEGHKEMSLFGASVKKDEPIELVME